ncbi:MAG: hypothetical protein C0606_02840 [Hyphomicrobiales bacterium]|nr:MAG: hypothetical protein C0606_02840 [Hyphomicrobiales bacterium]
MTGILYYFASILAGLSVAMLLPVFVAASFGEMRVMQDFALVATLTVFVAGATSFALSGQGRRLANAGGYSLIVVIWVATPLIASLPMVVATELSFIDALFDAVSGLTTTGASVVTRVESLPKALIFWRCELQWLGGFLTLLSILMILAPAGVGGLPNRHIRLLEASGRQDDRRIEHLLQETAIGYGAVSLACFVGLMVAGLPIFDALCLTFTTVSTGGFLPHDGTIADTAGPGAQLWLCLFMIIGATSVLWHSMLVQRRWHMLLQHRESYFVIGTALVLGVVYAFVLFRAAGSADVLPPLTALREGVFTAVSLVSTTGFEVREGGFAVLAFPLVLFIAMIGGGAFSTAGGLKQYRFGGMLVQAFRELDRILYPHGIRPARFGSQAYDIQMMKAVWSSFAVLTGVVLISAIILSLNMPDAEGGILAAVALLSNSGPIYESAWQEGIRTWPLFGAFESWEKGFAIFLMIIGRIEILALFGAINRTYWYHR